MIYSYVLSTARTRCPSQKLKPISSDEADDYRKEENELSALEAEAVRLILDRDRSLYHVDKLLGEIRSLWKSVAVRLVPLDTALLRVNRAFFAEVYAYMHKRIGFILELDECSYFDEREIEVLKSAERIEVQFSLTHALDELDLPGPCSWFTQLHHVLQPRNNLQEFIFRGGSETYVGSIEWELGLDAQRRAQALEELEEIVAVLRGLPKVQASKSVSITWENQETLQAGHDDFVEFWQHMSRLNG